MCTGYDGRVAISNICTSQRKGYDICPASEEGRSILMDAYMPLFESGVDYAQILDQNHGGSQYFCHSRIHGHPVAPGAWMTETMQNLLGEWNRKAGKMLFGCESAAAEPFIGNLLFSDNRYRENALALIGNLTALYRNDGAKFLYAGRMCKASVVECDHVSYPCDDGTVLELPAVLVSAWETGDAHALLLVNHTASAAPCRVAGREIIIPPLDGVLEMR